MVGASTHQLLSGCCCRLNETLDEGVAALTTRRWRRTDSARRLEPPAVGAAGAAGGPTRRQGRTFVLSLGRPSCKAPLSLSTRRSLPGLRDTTTEYRPAVSQRLTSCAPQSRLPRGVTPIPPASHGGQSRTGAALGFTTTSNKSKARSAQGQFPAPGAEPGMLGAVWVGTIAAPRQSASGSGASHSRGRPRRRSVPQFPHLGPGRTRGPGR